MPGRARRFTIFRRSPVFALTFCLFYIVAGKLGLELAFVHANATAVWPPTGIALAALLLFGIDLWPLVLIGAFVVNITTAGSVLASTGIAVGNALEVVVGAHLVNRFANGRFAIDRAQDLYKLAWLTGLVSTPLSATIGVTTLVLTGTARSADYQSVWLTWWMGDAVGAWVVAPVILFWGADWRVRWSRAQVVESALMIVGLVVIAGFVFGELGPPQISHLPLESLCIPVLLWIAFRRGPREATTAALALSVLAVHGTIRGLGPFASASQNQALIVLQTYMGVVSLTIAAVGALVAEQRRTQERDRKFSADLEERVAERTAQLAESQTRLLEAQRVAHVGNWEWHVDTDRLWWSEELFRIFGVDPSAAAPDYAGFIARVHPDDRGVVNETVQGALASGRPFEMEHRIVRPDGDIGVIYGRGRIALDEHGRATRLLGTALDVTDWKRLEAERADLFRQQAELQEAERANRLKDMFLATVSHELRTPLNAILGWLQILRARTTDASLVRGFDVIDRNAGALRRLIEDLLDVSAIINGKLQLDRRPVDLDSVVCGAVDSVRPLAAAKSIRLECVVDERLPEIEADPQRLHQIMVNLLGNALKFTEDHGRVEVDVRDVSDGSAVVLRVADTGIGIDPHALPFIFDAFRQGDSSTTRSHRGLGLGLAIVRSLVELHGGTVSAVSQGLGHGAVFTVTLPVLSSISRSEPAHARGDEAATAARRPDQSTITLTQTHHGRSISH